jgi:hypothetical protein
MKTAQGKWSHFTTACEQLQSYEGEHIDIFKLAARALKMSQKFYLPDGADVLNKRAYADVFDLLELPFDCIAILSETHINDTGQYRVGGMWVPSITLAFNTSGPTNDLLSFCDPYLMSSDAAMRPWCVLISLVKDPTLQAWFIIGAPAVVGKRCTSELAWSVIPCTLTQWLLQHASREQLANELQNDIHLLTNLCVMLGLKNVKRRTIDAPEAINAKRQKKGKLPLYSYHVLEVDNEVWDAPVNPGAQKGDGVARRSHLRRGHIRRLDETRRVWVRAAYVHGGAKGFVHKDYSVKA